MKIPLNFIALLVLGVMLGSCRGSSSKNPRIYNNKLMKLTSSNTDYVRAMNTAMTGGDYNKAGKVRKAWEDHLEDAISKANEVGSFNGDDALQSAILKGLQNYKKIVANEYKKLIAIRSKGEVSKQAKENQLLKSINHTFSKADKAVKQALADFTAQNFLE